MKKRMIGIFAVLAMVGLFFSVSPAMAGMKNPAGFGFQGSFVQIGGVMTTSQLESGGKSSDENISIAPNILVHLKMKKKPFSIFLGYSQQEEIQNFPNGNSITQGVADDLPAFGWTQSFKNSAKHRFTKGGVVYRKKKISVSGGIFHVSAKQKVVFSMVDTLGLLPLDLDSSQEATGIGFSFGVKVHPTEKTKLALFFRSGAQLDFKQSVTKNTMGGIFPSMNTVGFRDDTPARLAVEVAQTFPTSKGDFGVRVGYARSFGGSSEDVFGAKINRDANKFSVGGSWSPKSRKIRIRVGFGITDAGNSLSEVEPTLSSKTVSAGLDFGIIEDKLTASIDAEKIFYDSKKINGFNFDESGLKISTGIKLLF